MIEINVTDNSFDFHKFISDLIVQLVLVFSINFILVRNNMINLFPITVITLCLVYLNNYFYENNHYDVYLYKNHFYEVV